MKGRRSLSGGVVVCGEGDGLSAGLAGGVAWVVCSHGGVRPASCSMARRSCAQ